LVRVPRRGLDRLGERLRLRLRDGDLARARVLARDELRDRVLERRGVDELLLREERARDRHGHLAAGLVPLLALGRERLQHDGLELVGQLRDVRARRLDHAGADDIEERLAAEAAVERAAREDLPQYDSERIQVAPAIDLLAARLLGRHVAELALE